MGDELKMANPFQKQDALFDLIVLVLITGFLAWATYQIFDAAYQHGHQVEDIHMPRHESGHYTVSHPRAVDE